MHLIIYNSLFIPYLSKIFIFTDHHEVILSLQQEYGNIGVTKSISFLLNNEKSSEVYGIPVSPFTESTPAHQAYLQCYENSVHSP